MAEKFSFEKGIKDLSDIVKELEGEEVSLEKSIERFEEGMKISKKCQDILEKAELRIKKVVEENGKIVETDVYQGN